jgi:WD40 repeat protein
MTEETLFAEALSRAPAERAAFLAQACAGQPELRAAVEALLAAHEKSGNLLDRPPEELGQTVDSDPGRQEPPFTGEYAPQPDAAPVPAADGPPGAAGAVIAGRYTLVEKIGEGGMGEVWVAKQTEPVKRKVALKVIKAGMDSKAVLTRFEQERQALALMDHPNIARVLDGGMTAQGRPFFVMELVNGLPLNRFCDEARLTPRQRLELFVPICQAVQHAHQKGIVHRDLKPANILVTLIDGRPVPRVIDFGVAKAISGKLTDESLSTQFGAVVGTLEYMAPEQAGFSGADIDTRADIYSLGVILYELLTGLRPIDSGRLKKAAFSEMIRIIQEQEPPRPSTRLSTDEALPSLAALRQTEPRRLMALLRGELDWVVMKCLEKRRDRRYETASGLARDVERYLADEPVEACPPSVGYRLGKLVRKYRAALTAAGLFALLLLSGIVVSSWLAVRATRAEGDAREKETLANQRETEATTANAQLLASQDELRGTLYYARSGLLQNAWDRNDMKRVFALLDEERPRPGERDQRGFEWHYLDRQCHLDLLTLTQTDGANVPTAFSPDGRFVARGAVDPSNFDRIDGNVAIHDLTTGKVRLRVVLDAGLLARHLLWTPDSRRVIVTANNGVSLSGPQSAVVREQLIVFDAATGTEVCHVKPSDVPNSDAAKSLFFHDQFLQTSEGGKYLAGSYHVGQETGIRYLVVDAVSGKVLRTFNEYDLGWCSSRDRRQAILVLADDIGRKPGVEFKAVRFLDLVTGKTLSEGPLPKGTPNCIWGSFTPDGGRLVGAYSVRQQVKEGSNALALQKFFVLVLDATTGKVPLKLPALSEEGGRDDPSLAISPDGTRLASCASDGAAKEVRLWELSTGKMLERWRDVTGIRLVQLSPDGKRLATAGQDLVVRVWQLGAKRTESGTPPVLELRGHAAPVDQLVFHPDGTRLYTAAQDGTVKAGDLTTPGRTQILKQLAFVPPIDFREPAGRILTATSLWPEPASKSPRDLMAARNAPHKTVVTAWDLNGHPLHAVRYPGMRNTSRNFYDSWRYYHAWSPEGKRLATVVETDHGLVQNREWKVEKATLEVFEADTDKKVFSRSDDRVFLRADNRRDTLDTPASFSKDGTRLAWGIGRGDLPGPGEPPERVRRTADVMILETATGKELHRISCDGPITEFVFHPDGTRIAATGADGQVAIWDAATGAKVLTLERAEGMSVGRGLAYSPDGGRLATVLVAEKARPARNAVGVWDAQTGKIQSVLAESTATYDCFAFSPDGRRLATASLENRIEEYVGMTTGTPVVKVWDAATSHELLMLKDAGKKQINHLAFSPDGHRLCAVVSNRYWHSNAIRHGFYPGITVEVTVWDATPRPEK